MMHRFYARKPGGSTLCALSTIAVLQLALACAPTKTVVAPVHPKVLALNEQAKHAERSREYHKARQFYRQAIDAAPDPRSRAFATRKMVSALIFWGELIDAERLLQESLALDGRQASLWHDLGILQVKLSHMSLARRSLENAVALAQRDPRPRIALAALLVNKGDYVGAKAQYKYLLNLKIPQKIRKATKRALLLLEQEIHATHAQDFTTSP